MKIFFTDEQKTKLERLHGTTRDGRIRDRIKAVLLTSEGWSSAMKAQALRLHETTIIHHINEFVNKRKPKPENGGSDSMLSVSQTESLISQLSQHLFHHTRDIVAYIEQRWATRVSIPGMNKRLHRHAFTYKKPSGIHHKFSEGKQKRSIKYYANLKETVGDEPILFLDAVHPTQATKLSYGWIAKGHKKTVETTGSRTRLNIPGALNLNDIGGTVIHDYKTINDYKTSGSLTS